MKRSRDSEHPTTNVQGEIDTTYHTQQRDVFRSGLAAEIGPYAYSVWGAIKSHADFKTGDAYPGIRKICELTGMSDKKVQSSIKVLEEAHLLRVKRTLRKPNHYIARERMVVRVGSKVICMVVVDYIPDQMRERLAKLKAATKGDLSSEDVWAQVELIPGPEMSFDVASGQLSLKIRADEVAPENAFQASAQPARTQEIRQNLKRARVEFDMKAKERELKRRLGVQSL